MVNVVCSKCGAKGTSKCPYCRSVFPSDQAATMWRSVSAFEWEPEGKYRTPDLVLRLTYHPADKNDEKALRAGNFTTEHLEYLMSAIKAKLRDLCPEHDWAFAEGETSSIGCGHGSEAGPPRLGE